MELYLKLFEVLFPVFFIVGIGFLLGKKNPNFDTTFITSYAGNFGTPALVIFSLTSTGVTFDIFANISNVTPVDVREKITKAGVPKFPA